jgi:hypothetical protein
LLAGCEAGTEQDETTPNVVPTERPCTGTAVRATVRLEAAGPTLVSAALVDEHVSDAAGPLEIVDSTGAVLARAALPEAQPMSIVAPPGEEGGDVAAAEGTLVSIVAPWPAGASSIRLAGVEISSPVCACELGKADGTQVQPELVLGPGEATGRFDVAVLGDGYRASELGKLRDDAARLGAGLVAGEPFKSYAKLVNVWRIPVASTDSGAGHDDEAQDTAFRCRYGCFGMDRLICCDRDKVTAVVQASLPGFDAVLVLVNDEQYGGAGDSGYASVYNGPSMVDVARHELGHQLALRDEYTYPEGFTAGATAGLNCSASSSETTWEPWRGTSGIAAFPGCASTQWFRPTNDGCLMKALGKPLCPVCQEHLVKTIVTKAGTLADSVSPTPRAEPIPVTPGETVFRVTPAAASVEVEWLFEGASLALAGNSFTPTECHDGKLTARLTDRTPLVRSDPDKLLVREITWKTTCATDG